MDEPAAIASSSEGIVGGVLENYTVTCSVNLICPPSQSGALI